MSNQIQVSTTEAPELKPQITTTMRRVEVASIEIIRPNQPTERLHIA